MTIRVGQLPREGNALFGQITVNGCGIQPLHLAPDETQRVTAFDSLLDGAASHARTLTTHPAYEKCRRSRAVDRATDRIPDGHRLLESLVRYSEHGQDYSDEIRLVIRANDLRSIDPARLAAPERRFPVALLPGLAVAAAESFK